MLIWHASAARAYVAPSSAIVDTWLGGHLQMSDEVLDVTASLQQLALDRGIDAGWLDVWGTPLVPATDLTLRDLLADGEAPDWGAIEMGSGVDRAMHRFSRFVAEAAAAKFEGEALDRDAVPQLPTGQLHQVGSHTFVDLDGTTHDITDQVETTLKNMVAPDLSDARGAPVVEGGHYSTTMRASHGNIGTELIDGALAPLASDADPGPQSEARRAELAAHPRDVAGHLALLRTLLLPQPIMAEESLKAEPNGTGTTEVHVPLIHSYDASGTVQDDTADHIRAMMELRGWQEQPQSERPPLSSAPATLDYVTEHGHLRFVLQGTGRWQELAAASTSHDILGMEVRVARSPIAQTSAAIDPLRATRAPTARARRAASAPPPATNGSETSPSTPNTVDTARGEERPARRFSWRRSRPGPPGDGHHL